MNGENLPPRPSGRGMVNSRPESPPPTPARHIPEEPRVTTEPPATPTVTAPAPQPIREEPKTVHHSPSFRPIDDEKKKRRFLVPAIIAAAVIIIGVIAVIALNTAPKTAQTVAETGIDTSKYQAVFFTNGQVYFGKLHVLSTDSYKLTNAFYLQTPTTASSTAADSSTAQLISLSQEVYGPDDVMTIQKSQVMYYLNLKNDGKAAQLITNYQKSH